FRRCSATALSSSARSPTRTTDPGVFARPRPATSARGGDVPIAALDRRIRTMRWTAHVGVRTCFGHVRTSHRHRAEERLLDQAVRAARLRALCTDGAFLERFVVRDLAAGRRRFTGSESGLALLDRDRADVRLGDPVAPPARLPARRPFAFCRPGRPDVLLE